MGRHVAPTGSWQRGETAGVDSAIAGGSYGHGSAPAGDGGGQQIFVGRQPILDADQRLVAYELLFRSSARTAVAGVTDDVLATSRLLINTFNAFGTERVLGDKRAFINVSAELLLSDVLTLLPPERVVLEILETVEPSAAVVARCRALAALGYPLALDDFVYRFELEPLLATAAYVKFDVRALGIDGLAGQLQALRGRRLRFLAEKVETREEFRACRAQGMGLFQGYYFARPETLSTRHIDPVAESVMQLFSLVTSRAEPKMIEIGFRQDVALSYNLLRYINSVGFGLAHRVESIRHALVLLGHTKLARWLTLLMFTATGQNPAPPALFRTALVRARLTELLGSRRLPAAEHDDLFMCGMFSLLDVLLGVPPAEALRHLNLSQPLLAALLRGEGPYAPYLALARACEDEDLAGAELLAGSVGLSAGELLRAQQEALGWAEEVARAGEP